MLDRLVEQIAKVYGSDVERVRPKVAHLVTKFPAAWIGRATEEVAEVAKRDQVRWGLLLKILKDYQNEGGPPPSRTVSPNQAVRESLRAYAREAEAKQASEELARRLEAEAEQGRLLAWAEEVMAWHESWCDYPLPSVHPAWQYIPVDHPRRIAVRAFRAETADERTFRARHPGLRHEWATWFAAQPREFTDAFKAASVEVQVGMVAIADKPHDIASVKSELYKALGIKPVVIGGEPMRPGSIPSKSGGTTADSPDSGRARSVEQGAREDSAILARRTSPGPEAVPANISLSADGQQMLRDRAELSPPVIKPVPPPPVAIGVEGGPLDHAMGEIRQAASVALEPINAGPIELLGWKRQALANLTPDRRAAFDGLSPGRQDIILRGLRHGPDPVAMSELDMSMRRGATTREGSAATARDPKSVDLGDDPVPGGLHQG